jgi:hypothetical protein
MKTARIMLFVFIAACSISTAWAQYGLYGTPESLPAPQSYATPSSYPATATPIAQPAPVQSYQPAQPQYRYPAQPAAMARYQPYQPGSQYRYPSPSARPQVRMAAVQQPQPIPAPQAMPVEPVPEDSGMMNQMLNDQNCNQQNCGQYNGNCGGAYRGAVNQYEQSACGPNADACGYEGQCYSCPWYASISALALGRSEGRRLWTSHLDGHEEIQLANTQFGMPWKLGGEARIGRRFCCGCTPYALEATFWSTEAFSGTQVTDLYSTQGLYVSTPLRIENINFDIPGVGVCPSTTFFSGARSHTLTRRNEFYDFEINLLREQMAWACDSPWDIGWSVGVRYFRFQESLAFSAISHDGDYDAYFRDTATNNLVGVQFGFDAAYSVAQSFRLFITPKVGIYDNFLDSTFEAKARHGAGAYVNGTVDVPGYSNFPAHGSANGIAFLTQIDVGADWQFSRNWSARAGYRVVAVTGMALADDQYPQYLCDTPDMRNPQHYSSLILHGAFCGLTYNF